MHRRVELARGKVAGCAEAPDPFAPGSPEERYLRDHTRYIAPDAATTANLIWRLLFGVAVNVLVLWLLLEVTARPLGWLYGWRLAPGLLHGGVHPTLPGWTVWLVSGALLAGGGLAGVELLFRPKWLIVRQLLRAWGTRLLVVGVLFGVVLLVLPAAVAELRAELAGTGVLARTVWRVLDHTGQPAATTASGKTRLSEALALLNTLGIGTALLGVLRVVLRREQSRLVTLAAWVAVPLALTKWFPAAGQ